VTVSTEVRTTGPSHPQWNPDFCGTPLRDGRYCVRFKSKRADGSRRPGCAHHARMSIRSSENQTTAGNYSYVLREEVSAKFNALRAKSDLLDLTDELALFKALITQGIEQLSKEDEFSLGEAEWIFDKLERVSTLVATIVKIRNDTALTVAEIHFIQVQLAAILKRYVPAEQLRAAVEELFKLTSTQPQSKLGYSDTIVDGEVVKGESTLGEFSYLEDTLQNLGDYGSSEQ